MTLTHIGPHIENPAAYGAAISRYIVINAKKTFAKNFPDALEIDAYLNFGRVFNDDGRVESYKDGFLGSLAAAYDKYGKLSEKQVLAVRNSIEKSKARRAEWASEKAALDAQRTHLGVVGEKIDLVVTLRKAISIESQFGTSFIFIMEDAAKNLVIYKGNGSAFYDVQDGDTITIRATVKDHGVRDGVKQTIIQRPKRLDA